MNCNEAVAALVASLESGTPMTDAQREHIRTCERCRELLDSAKQFESELGGNGIAVPDLDDAVNAAEGEVLRKRTRRMTAIVVGVALLFIAALGLLFFRPGGLGFGVEALILAALISAGFAVPILLMIYVMRDSARRRMYKRLKPGRVIAGVCLGLSEKTNVDLLIIRLVFIALLFLAGGIGFWFYIALNVAMPVHPDDRQYLLRFRLRRWWARRSGHAEHHAG